MKLIASLLFLASAGASDLPKDKPVVDPLKDSRAEIAILQRDFLAANSDLQSAQEKFAKAQQAMMAKYQESVAACKKAGQDFEPNKIVCVAPKK